MRACTLLFLLASLVHAADDSRRDHHSYSNPEHVVVKHLDLELLVDFESQTLRGQVVLKIERTSKDDTQPLVLDTHSLKIDKVEISSDGKEFQRATFKTRGVDAVFGSALTVELTKETTAVRITYATTEKGGGLQWLGREQTASKKEPFLFTQSQAIHARSWIPVQDSPGVRLTYTARVHTPKGLLAVMSASNDPQAARTGDYQFEMKQPIPAYLLALAVGDLEFQATGKRTGIYAEPGVAKKAAAEFSDMEKMVAAVEELYGPYRWERYDVLVLPPSFPYGGMENPRLTFASPTVLVGDKSLVSLVAHELAHSWSGNLVSNATWRDFWLNEGFTVYLERRIIEKVYGMKRAAIESVLGRRSLERELAELKAADQVLYIDLKERDPIDGLTDVPYEKGALFLKHLERTFGREKFDAFLKGYFNHFAFQSITTPDFVAYLKKHLLDSDATLAAKIPLEEWLYKPGLPGTAPQFTAESLTQIGKLAKDWSDGKKELEAIQPDDWSTQEWLHFLNELPSKVDGKKLKELDTAFGLTKRVNSEIIFAWLLLAVRNDYEPAYGRLEEFLTTQGRRKFLKPLYEELVRTPEGKVRATKIYAKARSTYHPIAITTIDSILKGK